MLSWHFILYAFAAVAVIGVIVGAIKTFGIIGSIKE